MRGPPPRASPRRSPERPSPRWSAAPGARSHRPPPRSGAAVAQLAARRGASAGRPAARGRAAPAGPAPSRRSGRRARARPSRRSGRQGRKAVEPRNRRALYAARARSPTGARALRQRRARPGGGSAMPSARGDGGFRPANGATDVRRTGGAAQPAAPRADRQAGALERAGGGEVSHAAALPSGSTKAGGTISQPDVERRAAADRAHPLADAAPPVTTKPSAMSCPSVGEKQRRGQIAQVVRRA